MESQAFGVENDRESKLYLPPNYNLWPLHFYLPSIWNFFDHLEQTCSWAVVHFFLNLSLKLVIIWEKKKMCFSFLVFKS